MHMQNEEIITKAKWLIDRTVKRTFTKYVIDIDNENLSQRVERIEESVLQYIDLLYKDNKIAWVNLDGNEIEHIMFCMLLRGEII